MNQATTLEFTPTIMQKLLGRNYKWWKIIVLGFKSNTTYRWNSFAWLLSSIVLIGATILIWYINYSGKNDFESNFSYIFTYLIIGDAFIFSTAIQFDIGEDIQEGKLISKLLRPTSALKYYFFHTFGYQLFENLSKFILYLATGLIFSQYLILPSLPAFVAFCLIIIVAYLINSLIGIIVGLTAFYLTAFFGSVALFDNLKLIFSGRFFPLNVLPFLQFTLFLPFAFTFYHPMQIYLGKYDTTQTIMVFLGGIIWCVVLYFLAKLVFKMGLKRNESVGL